jgi:hypothetical protein
VPLSLRALVRCIPTRDWLLWVRLGGLYLPAFFKSSVGSFLHTNSASTIGSLSTALISRFAGDHAQQVRSWAAQLDILRSALHSCLATKDSVERWVLLLEYPLLRLQRRLDVVLLCGQRVIVIEFKVGAATYQPADVRQVEDYALDLRDFHEISHNLNIVPVLCATEAPAVPFSVGTELGVAGLCRCNRTTLSSLLVEVASTDNGLQIDSEHWDNSPYRPVPTIIEAAELLYAGHQVAEIAHASSNPENLTVTTDRLIEVVADAQHNKKHIVVFLTGVPGSGKTLVGLNAIHDPRFRAEQRPAGAFLSGNAPLVTVLREALARDMAERTAKTLADARREVRAEIQSLMTYLEEYLVAHPRQAPAEKVIVFDEAQRAWDAEYGAHKFSRPKSEPALFLEIMERHLDWAVIIALVGGGQEINRGERGLAEWGAALTERRADTMSSKWHVIAAPDIVTGVEATAWQSLFPSGISPNWVVWDKRLHLPTSARSYRCLAITQWVNSLLEGRIASAREIAQGTDDFPVYVTRSLEKARRWLLKNARGNRRCGLVATSGARRLRADGLGVTLSANELSDVANWYLLPKGDIRSSHALEVAANEYTCQGLELDYVGVCWDGDLLWDQASASWRPRRLTGSQWQTVANPDAKRWAINKYRVLLTRARIGFVIWVPEGSVDDPTRDCAVRNDIADILSAAGVRHLS